MLFRLSEEQISSFIFHRFYSTMCSFKQSPVLSHSAISHRGKQTSRKEEADSLKGKEREEDGGGVHAKGGGGGGGATAERREEKKTQRGSRLPTLDHCLKHNS